MHAVFVADTIWGDKLERVVHRSCTRSHNCKLGCRWSRSSDVWKGPNPNGTKYRLAGDTAPGTPPGERPALTSTPPSGICSPPGPISLRESPAWHYDTSIQNMRELADSNPKAKQHAAYLPGMVPGTPLEHEAPRSAFHLCPSSLQQ